MALQLLSRLRNMQCLQCIENTVVSVPYRVDFQPRVHSLSGALHEHIVCSLFGLLFLGIEKRKDDDIGSKRHFPIRVLSRDYTALENVRVLHASSIGLRGFATNLDRQDMTLGQ